MSDREVLQEQSKNDADPFVAEVSREIWRRKYRLTDAAGNAVDQTVADSFRRVATAAASVEKPKTRERWAERYQEAMADFSFLPAGRILAGAGSGRKVTLFNCFVLGRIGDDMASIFQNVKEAALTMQQGGGIGHDFSTLRPRGAPVAGVGADASGPVSFMDVWDAMCRTILSAGSRRGAMMGTLRCDHPDIEEFIAAKSDPARLRMFNLSVLVTDPFIDAVKRDLPWDLVFGGKTFRTVRAKDLWQKLMRATYDYAEPGVIFIDRVNALNNLGYCETIQSTNPCGEQPLPPYGACLLGSLNLAKLVTRPFEAGACLDEVRLEALTELAVRFLDSIIDVSDYPLAEQRAEALAKRRIGLGVTGLANALSLCGLRYGTPAAADLAKRWMRLVKRAAYSASAELAREKGAFPLFDREKFLAAPGVAALDEDVRRRIAGHGIRNGLLTSIAPTGTISLLANNVSSGVEPVFDHRYRRKILNAGGGSNEEIVEDAAHWAFRQRFGEAAPLPDAFVTAAELTPSEHLVMQAALQSEVDSAVSKTINCPADIPFEAFERVYLEAYDRGLKGCTTYRPNAVTGSVLSPVAATPKAAASPPLSPRQPVLAGLTYKLKWPDSDHAIYVTINDSEVDGKRLPFEIFINSKNLEHYAWTVALTRMISAVFRRGGDVGFVAEELKAIFDPRGGQWLDGRYVPSLLAAIGGVIEAHMRANGLEVGGEAVTDGVASVSEPRAVARFCPQCQMPTLTMQEGCLICQTCGYSKCG